MPAPTTRCGECEQPGRAARRRCPDCGQPVHQRCQAGHACVPKQARVAALEDVARARLLTYRAILTLQVDPALGSPAAWDWPARLGLRPPEGVVARVERLREEVDETGEPLRSAP
jgi:predicted  nucleic acid-binding Zn-ribbon protein